jgi:nucleoside-diphosphate-sugar epimerase
MRSNVSGTEALAQAVRDAGVERLVHLSSVSVYEPLATEGTIDEGTRWPACTWPYPLAKRDIECLLIREAENGLPVVILQPTIVYGPHAQAWTDGIAAMLRSGRVALPIGGRGVCNPVYVDDVVDAILTALDSGGGVGQRLLVTGPEPVSWQTFFASVERAIGTSSLVQADADGPAGFGRISRAAGLVSSPLSWARSPRLAPMRAAIKDWLGPERTSQVKDLVPRSTAALDDQLVALFSSRAVVSGDAAKMAIGFVPRVPFEEGAARTTAYLRWADQ